MNSTKGFTLIELIVVIAIIGVLTAILVPAMVGYITDSKLSTANSNSKLVYSSAVTYATECIKGDTVLGDGVYSCIHLKYEGEKPSYTLDGNLEQLTNYLKNRMGNTHDPAGYCSVKVISNSPTESVWYENPDSKYVGHYPALADKKDYCSKSLN